MTRYNVVHPGVEQNRLILCQSHGYPYLVPSVPYLPYAYPVLVPNSVESVPYGPYGLQPVIPSYSVSPYNQANPIKNENNKQEQVLSAEVETRLQSSKRKQEPDKHFSRDSVRCSCEKTRCLKLYCDCLKAGKECGIFCSCKDCLNKAKYKEREYALEFLKKRNGGAPGSNDNSSNTTAVVCTCQRSQCCKKYCSCYLKGVKCTSACSCINCKNK